MQYVFDFFGGRDRRPQRPERLFFGLMPDREAVNQVAGFRDEYMSANHLHGVGLRPDRFHLSLHHVGDYKRLPTRLIYAAQQAARAVSMGPFEVGFRFLTSFEPAPHKKDRRPLVLLGEGGEALATLFRSLGIALTRNGLRAAAQFTPHLTLAYGPDAVPLREIEPIRFAAKDFVLIHSRLGLTQYEIIDRWTLA